MIRNKRNQQVNSTQMPTSLYELVASCNIERCSGHFGSEKKYLKVNVLELKATHFGLEMHPMNASSEYILSI